MKTEAETQKSTRIYLPPLNFKTYQFTLKEEERGVRIFDPIRKKFVLLQPEEWVRQNTLCFLMEDLGVPMALINVEKQIKVGKRQKRYDVVVYKSNGQVLLTVECKAPDIQISQEAFNQIARYNMALESSFLMITNGMQHYFFKSEGGQYVFLSEFPMYKTLLEMALQ